LTVKSQGEAAVFRELWLFCQLMMDALRKKQADDLSSSVVGGLFREAENEYQGQDDVAS